MSIFRARIPTIVGLVVLVAGIGVGIFLVNSRRLTEDTSSYEPTGVRITNVADNKFSVSWTTKSATTGEVLYGKVGEKIEEKAGDDRDSLGTENGEYVTHHVTVAGLQPSTQYAFRIRSSEKSKIFDNNGQPYNTTTGPILTSTPPADSVYGEVAQPSSAPAEGSIVYVAIPGAVPLSTLVKPSGNWTISMSTARASSLNAYIEYDPTATVMVVTVESGRQSATANVNTANAAPVPLITLGQTYDFRLNAEVSEIAEISVESGDDASESGAVELVAESETPGIFNVDPLNEGGGAGIVILLNPSEDGESVATALPEFRGIGPESTVITITVESSVAQTDSVTVDDDGTWSWSPPQDLEPGSHTVTIAYVDTAGVEREISRDFVVYLEDDGFPAIESTPSASVAPSVSPSPSSSASPTLTPTPTPTTPATSSGIPEAGIWGPTALTGLIGLMILIMGLLLVAL